MLRGERKEGEPDPGPLRVMLAAVQQADPVHLHDVAAFADGDSRVAVDQASPAGAAVADALKLQGESLHDVVKPERSFNERRWFEHNATSARMA